MAARAMAGAVAMVALLMCTAMASAQTDCSAQFTAMQPCTDFVTNTLNAPSKQCCAAFKATQTSSPVCLCQLQQAFADPATSPGNATRANALPSLCAVAVDPTRCPGLLGLAPAVAPTPAPVPPVAPAAPAPKGASVDCSAEFSSLATCVEYISSNDTAPPADCCSSLLNVHLKRPVCLCQLLQQVNVDPSISSGLNVTKALDLPNICKVDTDPSVCPALLGEPVASPLGQPVSGAPGPDSGPAPEAGAPGTPGATPVITPEASPVATAPSGANSILAATPVAMLLGFVLSSLHFLF